MIPVRILHIALPLFLAASALADNPPPTVSIIKIQRDADLSHYPRYEIRNTTTAPLAITIASSLEDTDGKLRQQAITTHTLAPGHTDTYPAYAPTTTDPRAALRDDIALLRTTITTGDQPPETHTAIVGTPRPVPRDGDYFIGMNAALQRYTPEEQWRALRMMRAAGVRSLRVEPGFRAPEPDGAFRMDPRYEQVQLAAEAHGMNTLFLLSYFPPAWHKTSDKTRLAHDWARAIATHYKGRVWDYQYGNETNSGWGSYGAAADMAAHNQAMSLGTLAALPDARPATFAIAEALPDYLAELFRNGLAPYVRAVTLHPYCGSPEAGVAKLEANRRVIAQYAADTGLPAQQLWATEVGFHYDEGGALNPTTQQLTLVNGYTEKQQADYLARLYILARAKKIDRIYWYNFYGKNDRETFWLTDADFNPRPAYHTLKYTAPWLNDSTPLGGTASTEPIQKHLFRRADGTLFLAAWSLRDGIETTITLPPGGAYTATDANGKTDAINNQKLQNTPATLTLNETPVFIAGFPPDASTTLTTYDQPGLLADSLDNRPWSEPMTRWEARPGDTITVPCVAFNSTNAPLDARPVIVTRMPGWKIELPAPFAIPPGQTLIKHIKITAPPAPDTVPGVEYRFSFALETPGPRRTTPWEARIWLDGQFPYAAHLLEKNVTDFPIRRPVDESATGFGPAEITARHAAPALNPATIDGNLTPAKWSPDDFHTLAQHGHWLLRDATHPADKDARVRAALRWDARHLYVAWLVQDDDLSLLDLVSRDWRDADNVRLFLSAEPDPAKRSKSISPRDLLVLMVPTRQFHDEPPAVLVAPLGGYVRTGYESRIKIASRVWHSGYLIEAAIPLDAIGVSTPAPGQILGINLMSDDCDNGFRKSVSLLALKNYDYWNSPRSLAQLRLLP
ncbi:protein of unknown function (DUF1083) [Opitutaceae bacterium TAV1]|nr:protein of unknown function (DUF1083) [Opitutaceae bacterium TAV1]